MPGVGNANFLRTALNALRRSRGESELDAVQFLKLARAETKRLAMPDDMLRRNVNVGFSGGEKKRNEVLQMAILRPRLAILDETDSGLDIDALKIVAEGVNALRGPDFSALVITHHQRLLDYIVPDRVHVLAGGRIVRSGGPELAHELEAHGYADVRGGGVMSACARDIGDSIGRAAPAASWRRIAPRHPTRSPCRIRGIPFCLGVRISLRMHSHRPDLRRHWHDRRRSDRRRGLPRALRGLRDRLPGDRAVAMPPPRRSAAPACRAAASRRGNTPTCGPSHPPRSTNR